ncbi:MAG TPA: Bax inhibitor-1/YccA family protein [Gammaproteobacteria bacterium]|nr:Bax inhibitor-1/YccA family protein [Gammaproteobacteria bacterium]
MNDRYIVAGAGTGTLVTNKLIRNTYILLSMTLLFSAFTAGISTFLNIPLPGVFITLAIYFGLLYLTEKFSNRGLGLVFVFALTGFLGLTLGPLLSFYIHQIPNGSRMVMVAMGGTGTIFLGLSGYALTTRKDFSFMGAFLMAGILTAFVAGLAAYFFQLEGLSLAASAVFLLASSGVILWQTSRIVHGQETNYISATVTLYVSIYNIFVSLLRLLNAFSGDD